MYCRSSRCCPVWGSSPKRIWSEATGRNRFMPSRCNLGAAWKSMTRFPTEGTRIWIKSNSNRQIGCSPRTACRSMTSFPTKGARISIKNSRKILRNNWLRIKSFSGWLRWLNNRDDCRIQMWPRRRKFIRNRICTTRTSSTCSCNSFRTRSWVTGWLAIPAKNVGIVRWQVSQTVKTPWNRIHGERRRWLWHLSNQGSRNWRVSRKIRKLSRSLLKERQRLSRS